MVCNKIMSENMNNDKKYAIRADYIIPVYNLNPRADNMNVELLTFKHVNDTLKIALWVVYATHGDELESMRRSILRDLMKYKKALKINPTNDYLRGCSNNMKNLLKITKAPDSWKIVGSDIMQMANDRVTNSWYKANIERAIYTECARGGRTK